LLGIIFGLVALRRIRQNHRKGRWMAIAGMLLGCCWLPIFVVGFVNAADGDADGVVTAGGTVTAQDLRSGDCLSSLPEGQITTVQVVPCRLPHRAEVFASFPLGGTRFPGEDEVDRFGAGGCLERLPAHVGPDRAPAFKVFYVYPTAASWDLGDRDVHCVLAAQDSTMLPGGLAKAP